MALADSTRSAISFKKSIGFANTQDSNAFYNESIPSQFSISSSEVFGETIDTTPTVAVGNGVAQFVRLELGTNPVGSKPGFAYELLFPETNDSGGDFILDLKEGSVNMNGLSAEQRRVRNYTSLIPQKLNIVGSEASGYGYELYKDAPADASNRISPVANIGGNPVEWQVDPVAGVIVAQQELENLLTSGVSEAFVSCYVYTGRFLNDTLNNLPSGATSGGLDIIVNEDYGLQSIVDASAGTLELRVDLSDVLSAGSGVSLTGPTGTNNFEVSLDTVFTDGRYIRKTGTNAANGVYNFNGGSLIIDNSTGLGGGPASNGVVTSQADNLDLDNQGTLEIKGNFVATEAGFGDVTCNSLTELSSKRYKEDITEMRSQLNNLKKLKPVMYKRKETGKEEIGLIAEDVAEVYPEFVRFVDGKAEGINYSKMVSVLVQTINEMEDRLTKAGI